MKSLDNLYAELGLTGNRGMQKTASQEDVLLATLKKLAGGDSSDAMGTPKVPTNLGEAAANRDNGTSDPSQILQAFNSRAEKPEQVDQSTLDASQIPAMTQGSTSHKLNEVTLQAPAQANSGNTEAMEVIARKVASILRSQQAPTDVDLDQVYKVAYINDYLGRTSAQMQYAKMAQEMPPMEAPMVDAGMAGAPAEDPAAEILAALGQVSADELVAKKDALLMAIADVLDATDEAPAAPAAEEAEVKEAASRLLTMIQRNPGLKTKVAALLGK
jgi:hypothetical protein